MKMLMMISATAAWACVMDVLHAQNSHHRRNIKSVPLQAGDDTGKQA